MLWPVDKCEVCSPTQRVQKIIFLVYRSSNNIAVPHRVPGCFTAHHLQPEAVHLAPYIQCDRVLTINIETKTLN